MSHLVGDSSRPLASQTPGKPQPLAMPMMSAPHPAARLVSTRHLVGKVDKIRVGSGERPKKEEPASHDPSSVQKGRERGEGRWLKGPQTLLVLTRSPDLRVLGGSGQLQEKNGRKFSGGKALLGTLKLCRAPPLPKSPPQVQRDHFLNYQDFQASPKLGVSFLNCCTPR